MSAPCEKIEILVHRIDPRARLLRAWELAGGVSAQTMGLEIALPDGQARKLILRRHGGADLARDPEVAAHEFRLLQVLRSAGLAVPTPYLLDESGQLFATPCLVLEYVEGRPEFAPAGLGDLLRQLARYLARVHRLDGADPGLSFLSRQGRGFGERPETLDDSLDEGRIRDALESAWPLPWLNHPALLHGDFWPGNVLWRDGQLVAVVDWEDAALGDPLADLANSRLEILWAFGVDAMHDFTQRYQSLMPAVDMATLPYWDLCAALRPAAKLANWGLDEDTEAAMRRGHRWFVAQALAELAALKASREVR